MSDEENVDQDAIADEWAAALAQQEGEEGGGEGAKAASETEAQPAQLDELESDNLPVNTGDDVNLDLILDIPVTIAMEIGRTRISIRNLLQLNQGSVVELDRLAGEPMDVLVNGTLVAHGEVVVVNEKFGIRLTDVVSPAERVKKLK
ncbi:flagellar motor switch protein FliN [Thiohalobacter sp.]|uniref:flagellar motor switch protein FliN n=1 Tax=Thiohalobacter sp. TaxID=2025948 RepID=UPI00262FAC30|nr:flagellar motor switch protein FliN [Thiohalobacter sp.]